MRAFRLQSGLRVSDWLHCVFVSAALTESEDDPSLMKSPLMSTNRPLYVNLPSGSSKLTAIHQLLIFSAQADNSLQLKQTQKTQAICNIDMCNSEVLGGSDWRISASVCWPLFQMMKVRWKTTRSSWSRCCRIWPKRRRRTWRSLCRSWTRYWEPAALLLLSVKSCLLGAPAWFHL